jgi:tRNA pseudouridine32 synthase/23S rRNA pseudouridine746 synthase
MTSDEKIIFKKAVGSGGPFQASDFLAANTGLPKARIKDAMNKGAAWIHRKANGRERMRRATALLKPGDCVELFYDKALLSIEPPQARCVMDKQHYSIWHKPAGLLTQGTEFGDHCSLLRQAETHFTPRRGAFPVHRLDREAQGLVIVAHTKQAASGLSNLFKGRDVIKRYRVEALGKMGKGQGTIEMPLDYKPAVTKYSVLSYDPDTNTSSLLVEIETGRLHQIRRHLAAAGHPVMGDPLYGKGNKDGRPMRLTACEIVFICPFSSKEVRCKI